MNGDDLESVVPAAFAKLHPGWVPVHALTIVECYDPEADTLRLTQIVDDDLSTWAALGMAHAAAADLAGALTRPGAWNDDDEVDTSDGDTTDE